MTIYVANVNFKATEAELHKIFVPFGTVTRTNIITDRETGKSRGIAFVEMPNKSHAQEAIDQLNQTEFMDRTIDVREARPRKEKSEKSRRY